MSISPKEENILLIIRGLYSSMTKAEKKVADYILKNPAGVRFLSINDLAEACHVGYTSVFRFCKTLKLQGYQEFKIRLSMSIINDETNGEDSFLPAAITMNDSIETAAKKLMQCYFNAITETNALLNSEALQKATEFINRSDQVRFFGVAGSTIAAMEGMYKFLHIMPNVYCLQDSHMQTMCASTLNQNDVAIFISNSGEDKDIVEMAKRVQVGGAKSIAITRHTNSPLAAYCDIVLPCGGYEAPFQESSARSRVSELYILDVLFTHVYQIRFDYSKHINVQVAESIVDKNY